MVNNMHRLLVQDDNTDHAWGYFLKEKSKLKNVMMALINDLKTPQSIPFKYISSDKVDKN